MAVCTAGELCISFYLEFVWCCELRMWNVTIDPDNVSLLFSPWLQKSLKQGVLLDKQGGDLSLNSSGKKTVCIHSTFLLSVHA